MAATFCHSRSFRSGYGDRMSDRHGARKLVIVPAPGAFPLCRSLSTGLTQTQIGCFGASIRQPQEVPMGD